MYRIILKSIKAATVVISVCLLLYMPAHFLLTPRIMGRTDKDLLDRLDQVAIICIMLFIVYLFVYFLIRLYAFFSKKPIQPWYEMPHILATIILVPDIIFLFMRLLGSMA